uniref:Myotubularin phosphatase domain-containing protein n=1 Tax=Gongylonema pulchrum TaxID=637853 RepID=A0A183ESU8_9BILA
LGHGEDKHNDSERSPIFVQFIDCVWQIMYQRVKNNTVSLWSYIIAEKRRFLNPHYNQYPRFIYVLRPNTRLMCIRPWKEYYFRYNPAIVAQDRAVIFKFLISR